MRIGTRYGGDASCAFVVWAPHIKEVLLKIVSPAPLLAPMEKDRMGYWRTTCRGISPDTMYLYRLDGETDRPDPASHSQPDGVHGPSQVIDHAAFHWEDGAWSAPELSELIIYELHVGTFSFQGTFDAVIPRLGELEDLGISAIEIMPVGQFPGERNWGYDGVYPFAVQGSYGGPEALKRLVNECHKQGMAVILDVVYNHLGPEGNYLASFGPYFTDKYQTPWGPAVNFDDAGSDEVRNFFMENALHWFSNYHVDGLRLDAVHAIFDMSATPFLLELAQRTKSYSRAARRRLYLIAESDLNDPKLIAPPDAGGIGLDAVWSDDFHHSLHTLITGERDGYYRDYGTVHHLVKSIREGFAYSGEYSPFRKHRHGRSSRDLPGCRFIVFSQNHDQIGNRMRGERLSRLADFETLKLCSALILLLPYVPLLFMGEEYGEDSPFHYFVSHSSPELIEAVREGRRKEFSAFDWAGELLDPQSPASFAGSKIQWEKRRMEPNSLLLGFYKALIGLRRETPALASLDKEQMKVEGLEEERVVLLERWETKLESRVFCLFNLGRKDIEIEPAGFPSARTWRRKLDSADRVWNGPGSLLPDVIDPRAPLIVRGRSAAIYLFEEGQS
jgi:maltooligosyltrehalose trehalohydrolase